MTSCEPRPGQLWLAYVEFSDHPGVGKVCPVFIIDVQNKYCIALAAKVTSKDLRGNGAGQCIPITDWDTFGLRMPSYIRIDQKLELAFENLLNDAPPGTLPETYLELVRDELVE